MATSSYYHLDTRHNLCSFCWLRGVLRAFLIWHDIKWDLFKPRAMSTLQHPSGFAIIYMKSAHHPSHKYWRYATYMVLVQYILRSRCSLEPQRLQTAILVCWIRLRTLPRSRLMFVFGWKGHEILHDFWLDKYFWVRVLWKSSWAWFARQTYYSDQLEGHPVYQ